MKKQFVTYEIALKLEKIEFKEICLAHFGSEPYYDLIHNCENVMEGDFVAHYFVSGLKAPLWQQVIDWFIEKHDYNIEIRRNRPKAGYFYTINYSTFQEVSIATYTYYEAREAAILKAIELCQK